MPLYEIVLRFPDREEIRITDRDHYRAGDEVVIAGRTYLVTGTEQPQAVNSAGRFVLEPRDAAKGSKPVARGRIAAAEALAMHEASSEAAAGHRAAVRSGDRGSEASMGIAWEPSKR